MGKILHLEELVTFLPLSIVLRESSEISANLELQRIPQYFMASKSLDIWLFRPAESRDCCRRRMNANVVFAWYNHVLSGMENPDPENNMPSSKNVHDLGLSTKVSYEISCRRSATGYVSRVQCHTLKTHHRRHEDTICYGKMLLRLRGLESKLLRLSIRDWTRVHMAFTIVQSPKISTSSTRSFYLLRYFLNVFYSSTRRATLTKILKNRTSTWRPSRCAHPWQIKQDYFIRT